MATKIKKGQAVTLSTSETAYELDGDVNWPTTTTLRMKCASAGVVNVSW